jgi:hypothetical protein
MPLGYQVFCVENIYLQENIISKIPKISLKKSRLEWGICEHGGANLACIAFMMSHYELHKWCIGNLAEMVVTIIHITH